MDKQKVKSWCLSSDITFNDSPNVRNKILLSQSEEYVFVSGWDPL